ncbi:PRC-barrel domain-containing protein [Falsiroseomonas tokyonensis]|uniref:PRC-barrel domain-containing protein n=1 Tax=Falsiroseomonas tokyonensis TaxID=430521 RepID=A0ABV7C3C4_9PROT|nr:PRC-barrel domain-containing protein [Falsiroseomonas tokyonensis]MBU8540956.1 PRC-barrel domain-containing protein [Falsiroseomonas tokyonensis]
MKHLLLGTTAALLLVPALGMAQGQTASQAGPAADQGRAGIPAVAQQCLQDLRTFGQRMRDDGLWLSGYRAGYGWRGAAAAPLASPSGDRSAAETPVGTGDVAARGGPSARARAADVQAQGGGAIGAPRPGMAGPVAAAPGGAAASPWSNTGWRMPPMQEIRTLHAGAVAIAQRGEERGCQMVLAEAREAYGTYSTRLREAGVDADSIGTYRQQQLVAARPVTEMGRAFRADNITGTDVRSPRDNWLGSVEDVILDPNSGRITYLILARGGFLGIGEDYVAVPWSRLRATPGMDVFVLDTTEAALERAPKVEPDAMVNAEAYGQRRQQIDRFWQQQDRG